MRHLRADGVSGGGGSCGRLPLATAMPNAALQLHGAPSPGVCQVSPKACMEMAAPKAVEQTLTLRRPLPSSCSTRRYTQRSMCRKTAALSVKGAGSRRRVGCPQAN